MGVATELPTVDGGSTPLYFNANSSQTHWPATWCVRRTGFAICFVTTLKTIRAYLLKEAFQQLWDYPSAAWAAAKLGIPRQTLDSKIAALGIDKYRFKT